VKSETLSEKTKTEINKQQQQTLKRKKGLEAQVIEHLPTSGP
jgi:hypothetical protein